MIHKTTYLAKPNARLYRGRDEDVQFGPETPRHGNTGGAIHNMQNNFNSYKTEDQQTRDHPGPDMPPLVNALLTDLGAMTSYKQIRPRDLENLGYKISRKKIRLGDLPYEICEVLDEDSNKQASFCLMLSQDKMTGVILTKGYSEYWTILANEHGA